MKKVLALLLVLVVFGGCHVGRFFVYNFANIRDYKKFSNREIKPSDNPFSFAKSKVDFLSQSKKLGFEDQSGLDSIMEGSKTLSFLVIQNDSIKYEWNQKKVDSSSQLTSFSMAKSYISALVGIAVEEGKIKSVDEPITNYIKDFKNEGFDKITIEHVLNMRTGIDYVENYYNPFGNVAVGYYGRNLDRHLSKLKIKGEPGQKFEYISIGTQILGVILEEATGKTVTEYCQEKLWGPLGCEYPASWSVDRKNGREKAFCCLNARTRDYAKIGRLYLNGGKWQGKQIVPEEWVNLSTKITPQTKSPQYNYQWWHDRGYGIGENGTINFLAQGHLGQFVYVCPEKNAIIVRIGKNYGKVRWHKVFRSICSSL